MVNNADGPGSRRTATISTEASTKGPWVEQDPVLKKNLWGRQPAILRATNLYDSAPDVILISCQHAWTLLRRIRLLITCLHSIFSHL